MLGATATGARVRSVPMPPTASDLSNVGKRDWMTGSQLIETCMDTYDTPTFVIMSCFFCHWSLNCAAVDLLLKLCIFTFQTMAENGLESRIGTSRATSMCQACVVNKAIPFLCCRSPDNPSYDARYILRYAPWTWYLWFYWLIQQTRNCWIPLHCFPTDGRCTLSGLWLEDIPSNREVLPGWDGRVRFHLGCEQRTEQAGR